MNIINTIFRYIGYASISVILGWISFKGDTDFVSEISGIVLTVMLALLSLYVTLTGQLITQMVNLHNQKENFEIDGIVDAIKRNVVIEMFLIVTSLVLLVIKSFILSSFINLKGLVSVGTNAIIVFSILYFILVIYDSFMGLFKLIKINGSRNL